MGGRRKKKAPEKVEIARLRGGEEETSCEKAVYSDRQEEDDQTKWGGRCEGVKV